MLTTASRRDFLRMGMAAGIVLGTGTLLSRPAQAAWSRISLEQCVTLSPVEMAEASGEVMSAWNGLLEAARSIRNPEIRTRVLDMLNNPAPTLAVGMDQPVTIARLKAEKLLSAQADDTVLLPPCRNPAQSPQPFFSAPGSGWTSHHAYPGGLATHTALNVFSSLSLQEHYGRVFGFVPDRDVVLAAQLLHDLHKPWVFQWQPDGVCRTEKTLAGTGEHHILSLAESLKRGLPAEVVIAQACAHDHPGTPESEKSVVNWLRAASILSGTDPVAAGLLAENGKTLPLPRRTEGFLTHLGDHDWVLSVPAAQWLIPQLRSMAEKIYHLKGRDLEGAPFNAFRNYVFSQATIMRLYQTFVVGGEAGLTQMVGELVRA